MGKSRNKNHSNEVHDLKKENAKLRKEVAQLRKQLNRSQEDPTYEEFDALTAHVIKQDMKCPNCFNPIQITNLGLKELTVCTVCTYRKTKALQK